MCNLYLGYFFAKKALRQILKPTMILGSTLTENLSWHFGVNLSASYIQDHFDFDQFQDDAAFYVEILLVKN